METDKIPTNLLYGYVYLPVSDFDAAAKWYHEVFGFETAFVDPLYRELRSPSGIQVMLIERRGGVNAHMMYGQNEQAAYGFTVRDINFVHAALLDKGVNVKKIIEYQGKSFSFTDPDGNIIEIWEEKV
jgi:predicted enzyme related to lactoylglutathione lyase